MLGLAYNEAIDLWSAGCILYELYTGKILFPGKDNNEMLRLHQELKGAFPNRMVKRGMFKEKHFDPELVFEMQTKDSLTGQDLKRQLRFTRITRDLSNLLLNSASAGGGHAARSASSDADRRRVTQLVDLCSKLFILDPARRITVDDALKHPFLKD